MLSENFKSKKVFIAGYKGMVGSAITRSLQSNGYTNLLLADKSDVDLMRQESVESYMATRKPDMMIIAAAKVGGILANNTYRAEFLYNNLMIEANLIHAAYENGLSKVVFLGSSCIYPKLAPQPLKEESLLSGYLEYTNEPYAIAKITGIKLCESYYKQYGSNFFSMMPTNLYGYFDNFDLNTSHVLPALMRKFDTAVKEGSDTVLLWGTGTPKREFMFVDDLADAIRFSLENIDAKDLYENGITHLNVGTGEDLMISELATLIAQITGFKGKIEYDTSKPDGTPRKIMDVSRINNLGWKHKTSLEEGIKLTYNWYKERS
jgi:GDP-L-fucose synthase